MRNELKLTYHYLLSYIYNTFIVRHNKQRIYLKLTYGDCLKKMQKEHTYTLDGLINRGGGLYPGGLISGIIYSLANGWPYIWGGA